MGKKIVQSNELIDIKGNDVTANEKRIFFTLVSRVKMNDKDFHYQAIPLSEICREWELDERNSFSRIADAMDSLSKKSLERYYLNEDGKKVKESISFIECMKYVEGSGVLQVKLHDSIKPYLLELSANFTSFEYTMLRELSSNAMRMYELLKRWEGIRNWKATITDIRNLFSFEDKYRDTSDIEKKVIKPCVEEVNKYTDLEISYNAFGRGESKTYEFSIRPKEGKRLNLEVPSVKNELPEEEKLFERLWGIYPNKRAKNGVKRASKKELLKYDEEELVRAIERYKKEVRGKEPRFILQGNTFFNGRIFDYLDENYKTLPRKIDISDPNEYGEEDTRWI